MLDMMYQHSICMIQEERREGAPVEVVEEAEKVKAQLEETLLFVPAECAEDLRRVVHVSVVSYPGRM